MRMGRAGGLLEDGTAEEHLRIGALKAIFDGFRAKTTRPATRNSRRAKLVSDKDGCGHAKGR